MQTSGSEPRRLDRLTLSMRMAAAVSFERDGQLVPIASILSPEGVAFFTPKRMETDVEKDGFVEYVREYAKEHAATAVCFIIECWHSCGDAEGERWLAEHGNLTGYQNVQEAAFQIVNTRHGTSVWRADIVRESPDKQRLTDWKHDPVIAMFGRFSNILVTVAEA